MIQIPNYKTIEEIGGGGYGIVYRATDKAGNLRAIKFLKERYVSKPKIKSMFLSEAAVMQNFNHPNITKVIDFGEQDGVPYLVMPFYKKNLREELVGEPLKVSRAEAITKQLLNALDHAHEKGVIHRDLWPGNILFDEKGDVKLTDFGLAKILLETKEFYEIARRFKTPSYALRPSPLPQEKEAEGIESIIGMLNYASPEMKAGRETDKRTDIFSAGMILYEMLTGFVGGREDPSEVNKNENVPEYLDVIVDRALKTNAKERYQTVKAFLDDFIAKPEKLKEVVERIVYKNPKKEFKRVIRQGRLSILIGEGYASVVNVIKQELPEAKDEDIYKGLLPAWKRRFDQTVEQGRAYLRNGQNWGPVWNWVKQQHPEANNEDIDRSLGREWAQTGAYNRYLERRNKRYKRLNQAAIGIIGIGSVLVSAVFGLATWFGYQDYVENKKWQKEVQKITQISPKAKYQSLPKSSIKIGSVSTPKNKSNQQPDLEEIAETYEEEVWTDENGNEIDITDAVSDVYEEDGRTFVLLPEKEQIQTPKTSIQSQASQPNKPKATLGVYLGLQGGMFEVYDSYNQKNRFYNVPPKGRAVFRGVTSGLKVWARRVDPKNKQPLSYWSSAKVQPYYTQLDILGTPKTLTPTQTQSTNKRGLAEGYAGWSGKGSYEPFKIESSQNNIQSWNTQGWQQRSAPKRNEVEVGVVTGEPYPAPPRSTTPKSIKHLAIIGYDVETLKPRGIYAGDIIEAEGKYYEVLANGTLRQTTVNPTALGKPRGETYIRSSGFGTVNGEVRGPSNKRFNWLSNPPSSKAGSETYIVGPTVFSPAPQALRYEERR